MDETGDRGVGALSVAVGIAAGGSAVSLATFFAVGGPFGAINDVGNAAIGVLSAALAWRLRRYVEGRTGRLAVGAATLGAAITVSGSALVLSEATGYFLAGLVSSVGFAGIGGWLVTVNRSRAQDAGWPRRLLSLGVLAGGVMSLGVVAVPGVLLRVDDLETAPGWLVIGQLGWLGTYVVYPAWAIWLGLVETRRAQEGGAAAAPHSAQEGGGS